MSLKIGFARRRGLTSRDDPLYANALAQKHIADDLVVCTGRNVIEEVDHARFQCVGPLSSQGELVMCMTLHDDIGDLGLSRKWETRIKVLDHELVNN